MQEEARLSGSLQVIIDWVVIVGALAVVSRGGAPPNSLSHGTLWKLRWCDVARECWHAVHPIVCDFYSDNKYLSPIARDRKTSQR